MFFVQKEKPFEVHQEQRLEEAQEEQSENESHGRETQLKKKKKMLKANKKNTIIIPFLMKRTFQRRIKIFKRKTISVK